LELAVSAPAVGTPFSSRSLLAGEGTLGKPFSRTHTGRLGSARSSWSVRMLKGASDFSSPVNRVMVRF
jgi:hypothetical protein